jgi:crossover junction endodeoxyribonuclease RuvC
LTRILGIDPGSRVTGYGVVETDGTRTVHLAGGRIVPQGESLGERLRGVFEGIRRVLEEHAPQEVAVEDVFVARNASSALKLGQARAAAVLPAVLDGLPLYEYTPARVKQAVTGHGRADKAQVQHMVRLLLGLAEALPEDVADGLAVALCHAHTRTTLARLPVAAGYRAGRLR